MAKPAGYPASSESTSARLVCPLCGHDLVRVPRRLLDRLFSLFAPAHRYRCRMHDCQWEGTIRVAAPDPTR